MGEVYCSWKYPQSCYTWQGTALSSKVESFKVVVLLGQAISTSTLDRQNHRDVYAYQRAGVDKFQYLGHISHIIDLAEDVFQG